MSRILPQKSSRAPRPIQPAQPVAADEPTWAPPRAANPMLRQLALLGLIAVLTGLVLYYFNNVGGSPGDLPPIQKRKQPQPEVIIPHRAIRSFF